MNVPAHFDVDRLAARMLRDYDAHTPGTLFAEGLRLSLDEAQNLQDTVARLRTARGGIGRGWCGGRSMQVTKHWVSNDWKYTPPNSGP